MIGVPETLPVVLEAAKVGVGADMVVAIAVDLSEGGAAQLGGEVIGNVGVADVAIVGGVVGHELPGGTSHGGIGNGVVPTDLLA